MEGGEISNRGPPAKWWPASMAGWMRGRFSTFAWRQRLGSPTSGTAVVSISRSFAAVGPHKACLAAIGIALRRRHLRPTPADGMAPSGSLTRRPPALLLLHLAAAVALLLPRYCAHAQGQQASPSCRRAAGPRCRGSREGRRLPHHAQGQARSLCPADIPLRVCGWAWELGSQGLQRLACVRDASEPCWRSPTKHALLVTC